MDRSIIHIKYDYKNIDLTTRYGVLYGFLIQNPTCDWRCVSEDLLENDYVRLYWLRIAVSFSSDRPVRGKPIAEPNSYIYNISIRLSYKVYHY